MIINTCPLQKDTCNLWNAYDPQPLNKQEAVRLCIAYGLFDLCSSIMITPTIIGLANRAIHQYKAGNIGEAMMDGTTTILLIGSIIATSGLVYAVCSNAFSMD